MTMPTDSVKASIVSMLSVKFMYQSSANVAMMIAGVMTFADKGYQGAEGTIRTPFKRPLDPSLDGRDFVRIG